MAFKDDALKQVRESMPDFEIDSHDFKMIEGWNYLGFFVLHAMNSIQLAKKFNDDKAYDSYQQVTITQSLFKDSVMSYCKCFSSSEKPRIKIDINAIVKDFSSSDKAKYKKMHDRVLLVRNKYVAHNLENDFEISVVAVKQEGNKIVVKPSFTLATPINEFDAFFEQYALVSNYLILKINKILDKVSIDKGVEVSFG